MREHNPSSSNNRLRTPISRRGILGLCGIAAGVELLSACGGERANTPTSNPNTATQNRTPESTTPTPETEKKRPNGLNDQTGYNILSNGELVSSNDYEKFAKANTVFAQEGVDITEYGQVWYDEKFKPKGDPEASPTPTQLAESLVARLNVIHRVGQGGNRLDPTVADALLGSIVAPGTVEDYIGYTMAAGNGLESWSKPEGVHDARDLAMELGLKGANNSSNGLDFPIEFVEVTRVDGRYIRREQALNPAPTTVYSMEIKVTMADDGNDGDLGDRFITMLVGEDPQFWVADKKGDGKINHMKHVEDDPNTPAEILENIANIPLNVGNRWSIIGYQVERTGNVSEIKLGKPSSDGTSKFPNLDSQKY